MAQRNEESWSRLIDFSEALKAMKMGSRIAREAWRGHVLYWQLKGRLNKSSASITEFAVSGKTRKINRVKTEDVLAEDWWIVT